MPALATTSPNLDDDDDNDFIGDDVYEMQGDFKHSPLAAYLSCSEEKADLENEDAETEIVSNLYACVINYYICFLCWTEQIQTQSIILKFSLFLRLPRQLKMKYIMS